MTDQSFASWYERGPFSAFVKERRLAGAEGVSILHAVQEAGDLSDPVTTDLVLGLACNSKFDIQCDYGFGRFRTKSVSGTGFLRPPGAAAAIEISQPNILRFFCVDGRRLRALVDDDCKPPHFGRLHTAPLRDALLLEICERIWDAAGLNDPFSRLYCDRAILFLLSELGRLACRNASRVARGGLTPRQLRLACERMMATIARGLPEPGLVELGALVELSPNHFCHAFKVSTGDPPHRWLARQRMERARTMLLHSRAPVADIALSLGYGSQSAFGAAFRRVTGVSPGAYRRGATP